MTDQLAIQTVVVDPLGGSAGDGTTLNFTAGRGGDVIVTQAHGTHYHQAYRGHTFCARSARAGNALPIFSATTANTWGLLNPAGSGVNLEFLRADFISLAATEVVMAPVFCAITGSALSFLLATQSPVVLAAGISNLNPGSTAYVPKSQLFNGATAFTTVTQADLHMIALGSYSATAAAGPNLSYDFNGMLVVPPGTLMAVNCLIAASQVSYLQVIYNEVPV